jgi:hypothetical protein
MKNKRAVSVVAILLSIIVIIILVVSLVLTVGVGLFVSRPASTSTSTPLPDRTNGPNLTATLDACAPGNVQAITQNFNKLTRQFDDIAQVALNTPGNQLAPLVTQLQDVRRNAEDYDAPPCLQTLKQYQLNYMNTYINTLLTLYSAYPALSSTSTPQDLVKQDVAVINQGMAQGNQYHKQYEVELATLLGITLPAPTDTPAATQPVTIPTTPTP